MKINVEDFKRKCNVCKAEFELIKYQADNNCCSNCQHWVDNVVADWSRDWAVVEGEHYVIGAKLDNYTPNPNDTLTDIINNYSSKSKFKGMGGAKYIVNFNDGRMLVTDDLWHQGAVPENFRNVLQDNAELENV